jgi:hypothetical protein
MSVPVGSSWVFITAAQLQRTPSGSASEWFTGLIGAAWSRLIGYRLTVWTVREPHRSIKCPLEVASYLSPMYGVHFSSKCLKPMNGDFDGRLRAQVGGSPIPSPNGRRAGLGSCDPD